tara:strand:- start:2764 stop:3123 length:360 start_codon:yes stop_codon:yes gene_type:complete
MMMACGFEGFGLIATVNDTSIAIVKKSRGKIRTIAIGSKNQAIASADDFMREIETSDSANKSKRWLNSLVSEKQINHLSNFNVNITAFDLSWNRYKANCWLNYFWNKSMIDSIVYKMGA